jgi:hypothetical protein
MDCVKCFIQLRKIAMGLSNMSPGGAGGGDPAAGALPDFGDRLGNYFESRFPVSGGLADMVFGQNAAPESADGQPATAPLALMPQAGQQDTSMLAMNAQPQQGGGGLATLLKLLV